jgi:predicted peptidase
MFSEPLNRLRAIVALVTMLMFVGVACSNNGNAGNGSMETNQTKQALASEERSSPAEEVVSVIEGDREGLPYVLTIPIGYESEQDKKWPLIVMLNGYGSAYSSLKNGLVAKAAVTQRLPMLTLSPHRERGWDSPGTEVIKLINEVSDQYRVDPSRVYLTGFSYGGVGTWALAGLYPEKFAAIGPIAAGKISSSYVLKLVHTPIWAFHNEGDDSMPLADHQAAVDAVRKAGNTEVNFTVYPRRGHDSWTDTYSNSDLYDWLLTHSL